jgi:hypothetical protein
MTNLQNLADAFCTRLAYIMSIEPDQITIDIDGDQIYCSQHVFSLTLTNEQAQMALSSDDAFDYYFEMFTDGMHPYRVSDGRVTDLMTDNFVGDAGMCIRGYTSLVEELLNLGNGVYWRYTSGF